MGRSQRHLREIQHVDSEGYDAVWKGWGEGRRGRPDAPPYEGLATVRKFVAEGDSLTAALQWATYSNQNAYKGSAYKALPTYTVVALRGISGATLENNAGNSLVERAAGTDALLVEGGQNVLSVLIGANGMNSTGTYPTATSWLTPLAAYLDARRAAGWYIVLCTILPQNSAPFNTRRAIVNTEMRLWTSNGSLVPGKHADLILDFGAHPIMGLDATPANATYYTDGVHFTQVGNDLLRDMGVKVLGAAAAADTNRTPPSSITRKLYLTPTTEAGKAVSLLLATEPWCSWEILAGSDGGFSINSGDKLLHAAGTPGTYIANLRGTDSFGHTYEPTLTLTVTPQDAQPNLFPIHPGFHDFIRANDINSTGIPTVTRASTEEINDEPVFVMTSLDGAGYPQLNVGSSGALVSGGLYEYSFTTWKGSIGSAPSGVQVNSQNYTTAHTQTPTNVQGTFTSAAGAAFSFVPVIFAGTTTVGETMYLDDVVCRRVLGATLSAGSLSLMTSTTARINATTTGTTGTMYAVMTTSVKRPTKAQIKAGQSHLGVAAAAAGSVAVGSAGAKQINVTGLTPSTTYYAHVVHEDTTPNYSNTLSTAPAATTA